MTLTKDDVQKLRQDFPVLQKPMHGHPLIYLDSAATSQKPKKVIEAIEKFYSKDYGTVHRAVYELSVESTKSYQKVRSHIKDFINAKEDAEIIFTKGTTESINLVASSFGKKFIQPGDEVIISQMEHHSNIVPWQIVTNERGANLKIAPITNAGELDLEALEKLITDKTKLVSLPHMSNVLGTINPLKTIAALAHAKGAKVMIDGAQGAPHLKVDVQDSDIDFYAFSGHKLYGPTGIGILYGKKELLEEMPPYQAGGDMIETVTFEKTTYNTLPLKFEAGTPMIAEVIGLGAALEFIKSIGLENIEAWEKSLLEQALPKIQGINGLHVHGLAKEKGGIITFSVDGVHPLDIGTLLDLKGIAIRTGHLCAQPLMRYLGLPAFARFSFGVYTLPEEIDHAIEELKWAIGKLK